MKLYNQLLSKIETLFPDQIKVYDLNSFEDIAAGGSSPSFINISENRF